MATNVWNSNFFSCITTAKPSSIQRPKLARVCVYVNFPIRFLQLLTKTLCSHTDKNNSRLSSASTHTHTYINRSYYSFHRGVHKLPLKYTDAWLSWHAAEERQTHTQRVSVCLVNVFDVDLEATFITHTHKHTLSKLS